MEFSGLAYCADNKKLNFGSFMSSGTLIHKTSNMGIAPGMHNTNEIPFVELNGHKLQGPIVNSSFEINHFSGSFSISEKIHNFTSNAKSFVKSDNIFTHKNLYGHQFPTFSFSQLVGGFVGSKSQIGSSSKESCQMWDIIFDKLAEFCGTHHHTQNCYNFGKAFSQDVLKSFCRKEKSSCAIIENSVNITSDSKLSQNPNSSQDISDSYCQSSSDILKQSCTVSDSYSQPSSEISKQSYAEVARTFATVQQNKQSTPSSIAMPRRRNSSNRRNFVKCEISHTSDSNWRNHCSPQIKEFRKHTRFFSGSQRRSDNNNNFKSSKRFEKEQKTDKCRKQNNKPEFQRVDNKKNPKRMTSDSVQIVPKISKQQECHVAASETSGELNNKVNRGGQTSMRMRFLSECSTDSDDGFVVFDSEADNNSVIMTFLSSSTSDSDLSEDVCSYQFSDDEDENTDCIDGVDTQTVTDLSELNKWWEKETSAYPTWKKDPVKVHFASNDTLQTVHPMVAWNFAYRAARCGPWEQMARDRERFKRKIKEMEPVLAGILSPEHRCHIWKERMESVAARTS